MSILYIIILQISIPFLKFFKLFLRKSAILSFFGLKTLLDDSCFNFCFLLVTQHQMYNIAVTNPNEFYIDFIYLLGLCNAQSTVVLVLPTMTAFLYDAVACLLQNNHKAKQWYVKKVLLHPRPKFNKNAMGILFVKRY